MSDTEETPLEESRESKETEKEEKEEYNPSFEEDRLQQSLTDGTLSWEESQEDGEGLEKWMEKEEQIEGEEMRGVEESEERGEEEERREEEEKRWEGEEEKNEEKERSKEMGDEEQDQKKEEEYKGEREEGREEEEEEKSGEWEEEESIEKPIQIDDIVISPKSSISETGTSASRKSSQSQSPEVSEIYKNITMKADDMEETGQKPKDTSAQKEGAGLSPEERQKLFQSKELDAKESLVSVSTEDTLFQKEEEPKVYPLNMTWSFGWNSSLPVYYMREDKRVILYISGHTAVIYNVFKNTQYHLKGHPNIISCLCVSEDRRWIATADEGPDCLIIIWDAFTGIPVHTIFDSCPDGNGIRSIAITRDAKFLATISDSESQKVCIWKWTLAVETPTCTLELPKEYAFQLIWKASAHCGQCHPWTDVSQTSLPKPLHSFQDLLCPSQLQKCAFIGFCLKDHRIKIISDRESEPSDPIWAHWLWFSQHVVLLLAALSLNSNVFFCAFQFEDKGILAYSAPILTEKTFNKLVGKFSQSVFHLKLPQVLSATKEGKLVVWDIHYPSSSSSNASDFPFIKPRKLVHLQREAITVLMTIDSYIVTGDIKGNIKFYDHTFSIVNWYSKFKLSAIRTLSFSKTFPSPPTEKSNLPTDCTLRGDVFVVRNFIIGTFDATVYHMTVDGTKLEKLFVEPRDAVYAISCHPYQPLIAVGSVCGMIKVWDFEKKVYLFSRTFEKGLGVQCLTYNPEGALLGAGFTEGTVYILDAMSLENESSEPFKYSKSSVTHVSFSHDSNYMATADVSFTVAVYVVVVKNGQRVWEYLARLRSHRNSIRSLLFGVHLDSNEPRLLSLGKDRFLIEYDLIKSYKDHLDVLDIHRTDQGNYPTCMIWYPPLTKELFLLICSSGYKVKLFNATTKMCRKTLLGPAYGSPIEHAQVLPVKSTLDLQKRYLVFINKDKVGLQILPVDGNPHKTCAVVCHPNGVAGLALSYDGHFAFTAGGQDRSVVQWKINLGALEAAVSLGGEDLTPFYGLVSGGRKGKFYRELEDYFYYSQIRSQGIDTMETRQVSEHICLSELPFVMRAIGFYPSEEKIEDMFNEIKFGEYVDTGKLIDKINLPDFLKVYLNHRPPFGNTMDGIQNSFDVLGFTNSEGKKAIRREDFLNLLQTKGEHMTEEEMFDCFATLFGLTPEGWKSEPAATFTKDPEICLQKELPEEITAEIFTTEILGLTLSSGSEQLNQ
ncbi:cilia- and flagella-associated protein 251 [Mastomys coucha]|uniref:cilia- and flagella-associated protein 251 n=1 Tax=Mastomys coucha TaxID=35658 RepID=UPI0012615D2F|nr:cilia- and flagella-associated protein 251 [Mastomys coucha]